MKLSVILNTARGDHPYVGERMKDVFLLTPTLRSLAVQEVPIYELIVVDGIIDDAGRARLFEEAVRGCEVPFPVQRCRPDSPLFPDYVTICAAKNTGLRRATGDAVWFIDDGMEAPPHATKVIEQHLSAGRWPSAFTHYFENEEVALALPNQEKKFENGFDSVSHTSWELYGPDAAVKDSRYAYIDPSAEVFPGVEGGWWRGYTAAPIAEVRVVGGFDETLDGVKGLEDPDMGERMERAHGRKLVLDRSFWVREHRGNPYDPRAVRAGAINPKCNLAIIHNNRRRNRTHWAQLLTADLDEMVHKSCSTCGNLTRCKGEYLAGRWTPPNATEVEKKAFEAWRAAYVVDR